MMIEKIMLNIHTSRHARYIFISASLIIYIDPISDQSIILSRIPAGMERKKNRSIIKLPINIPSEK